MVVPGPRPGDEDEPPAAVAELLLEQRTRIGGDQIAGGGRIAVVQHAYRSAAKQRLIEPVEGSMRIHQVLRRADRKGAVADLCGFRVLRLGNGQIPHQRNIARIERYVVLQGGNCARQ